MKWSQPLITSEHEICAKVRPGTLMAAGVPHKKSGREKKFFRMALDDEHLKVIVSSSARTWGVCQQLG